MKLFNKISEVTDISNSIITVGTFDGLHIGNQKILKRLKEESNTNGWKEVVVTFDPHPQIVLEKRGTTLLPEGLKNEGLKNEGNKDARERRKKLKLLTTIDERILLFETLGIENLLIEEFTIDFSMTKPDEFIKDYLISGLGMKKILVGYDHFFGKNREGNWELLISLSSKYGYKIERIDAEVVSQSEGNIENIRVSENNLIVSSTKIREALYRGDLKLANTMLGYDYIVSGKVVPGSKRGQKLGWPTANIKYDNEYKILPGKGVYFVSSVLDGKRFYGMANIGTRPTFNDSEEIIFEVHFFDLNLDLYDKLIFVELHNFIRGEQKFNSPDDLVDKMKEDERFCKHLIEQDRINGPSVINSFYNLRLV